MRPPCLEEDEEIKEGLRHLMTGCDTWLPGQRNSLDLGLFCVLAKVHPDIPPETREREKKNILFCFVFLRRADVIM